MSRPPNVPQLITEVAFASDPLAESYARLNVVGIDDSWASTPDANSLDISGDLEMVVRAATSDWTRTTGPGFQTLIGKESRATTKISYSLYLLDTGKLTLAYSTNGTTIVTVDSTVAVPFTDAERYWMRCTFDVNNGAGGKAIAFWWAADSEVEPISWTQIGTTVTSAGTVTIANTTAALGVGGMDPGQYTFNGQIFRAIVRNGIGGTVVADFDPSDAGSQSTSTFGSTRVSGQTWTVDTSASLSISPSWTDISAYVRSVNGVEVRRGKQTEVETTASSSLSLTLDNRDRRFDPTYASGPYYGNLKPRKAIRVRALWNNTYYPIYQGFVDGWPQDYFFRRDASVRLTAYDALAFASQVEIESFAFNYLQNTIGNLRYYLYSVAGNRWVDLSNPNQHAQLSVGQLVTSNIGNAEGDGVLFGTSTSLELRAAPGSNASYSISFWLQSSVRPPSGAQVLTELIPPTIQITIDSQGRLYYQSDGGSTAQTTRSITNGQANFVTIVQNGTSPKIYVNGDDVTSDENYTTGTEVEPSIYLIGSNGLDSFTGSLQSLALNGSALTAAQAKTLYQYASRDALESTATRMGNVLGLFGWPAGLEYLTPHPQVDVREVAAGPVSALSELQTVADSEYGRLFVMKDGKVALQDRFWHITSTRGSTTQATFSDDGSDTFYAGTGFDYSDREVANRVTVNGSFGLSSTVDDATSKTAYGLQTFGISTYLALEDEVVSAAAGILSRRKDPILRADAITVKPARQPSSWPTVLGLELGDRIVIEVTPRGVTPQIQRTLLIERLDWSISIDRWELAITGSPVPAESYWLLNTSELDTETVLGW